MTSLAIPCSSTNHSLFRTPLFLEDPSGALGARAAILVRREGTRKQGNGRRRYQCQAASVDGNMNQVLGRQKSPLCGLWLVLRALLQQLAVRCKEQPGREQTAPRPEPRILAIWGSLQVAGRATTRAEHRPWAVNRDATGLVSRAGKWRRPDGSPHGRQQAEAQTEEEKQQRAVEWGWLRLFEGWAACEGQRSQQSQRPRYRLGTLTTSEAALNQEARRAARTVWAAGAPHVWAGQWAGSYPLSR